MTAHQHRYVSAYKPGDRIAIDGKDDLKAVVDTVGFDLRGEVVCVEYWSNSGRQTVWMPPSRLAKVER